MQTIGTFFVAFAGYAAIGTMLDISPIVPSAIACGVGAAAGLLFSRVIER